MKRWTATRVSSFSTSFFSPTNPVTAFYSDLSHFISCQCGVSRSATMVIALVMRAAAMGGQNIQPDVLALRGRGMQAAYDYVQKKSKSIGPNMS